MLITRVEHMPSEAVMREALDLRKEVLHIEGGKPLEHVNDRLDATAEQFVAFDNALVIGTARYRRLDEYTAKVERVAVLSDFRGYRVGSAIMSFIEETAMGQGITRLTLDSIMDTTEFYEKLGFIAEGETFCEVGLPHIIMSKTLTD